MNLRNDVSFFKNKVFMQVCIGLHYLQLNFSDDLMLEIGNEIIFEDENGDKHFWSNKESMFFIRINSILEKRIIDCYFDEKKYLYINFENNNKIILLSLLNNSEGEAYVVHFKTDFEVV